MKFQFDSVQDFFAMGGHGFYIWLCYAVVFAVWGYLILAPKWQIKGFIKQEQRREERRTKLEEEGR